MTIKLAQLQAIACERAGHAVSLERYGALALFDGEGAAKTSDATARLCRMKLLLAGEPEMSDWRRFRMDPADVEMVRANFAKDGVLPLLYDHGWSGRGTLGAGRIVELPTDTADIDIICRLTPLAWQEAVVDGAWLSRSAGFYGWQDREEKIHPVALEEGSLTSLPAMRGLGEIRTMADLRSRLERSPRATVNVPDVPKAASKNDPALPRGDGKEQDMKLSKEALKKLGLPADATEEQVDAALLKMPEASAPAASPAPAPLSSTMTKEQLDAMVGESMKKTVQDAIAANDRAHRINELVARARDEGKIPTGDGDDVKAEETRLRSTGEKLGTPELETTIERMAVRFPPATGRGTRYTRTPQDTPPARPGGLAGGGSGVKAERHPSDFVVANQDAYDPSRMELHERVIAYMKENKMSAPGDYATALHAVTRRRTVLREVEI